MQHAISGAGTRLPTSASKTDLVRFLRPALGGPRRRLMSCGLSQSDASAMIASGFVEPITKELPLEHAVEMNRLIQIQMEGSVG